MRNAVVNRLFELAKTNDRIVLITGDLGFGVLTDFAKTYPDQFLNVGVAEQNMTVVLVEQYLDFVKEFGHDFYIMNRGRVTANGETSQLTQELISTYLSV